MTAVERLLAETLANGELDRQLTAQHHRWRHLWDYGDFREAVLQRAWEQRDHFRGETAAEFLAWLRRLAWSLSIDRWRERRRETGLLQRLARLLPRFSRPPEEAVDTRDLVDWLLAGLTERERKLLVLKYYQQLSGAELAAALDSTPEAVAQLHYRALLKLRQRLAKNEDQAR
jgi:RNA polymerase sigma-70 factor (ECF subfamily)